jgi:predicted lipoprotein
MRLFEERAERDNLSPTEIAKTYKEIDRLLEAKGDKPLKPEQRKDLAEQIMRQAADPTTIDQGS